MKIWPLVKMIQQTLESKPSFETAVFFFIVVVVVLKSPLPELLFVVKFLESLKAIVKLTLLVAQWEALIQEAP